MSALQALLAERVGGSLGAASTWAAEHGRRGRNAEGGCGEECGRGGSGHAEGTRREDGGGGGGQMCVGVARLRLRGRLWAKREGDGPWSR